jgi:hypothetical protein
MVDNTTARREVGCDGKVAGGHASHSTNWSHAAATVAIGRKVQELHPGSSLLVDRGLPPVIGVTEVIVVEAIVLGFLTDFQREPAVAHRRVVSGGIRVCDGHFYRICK